MWLNEDVMERVEFRNESKFLHPTCLQPWPDHLYLQTLSRRPGKKILLYKRGNEIGHSAGEPEYFDGFSPQGRLDLIFPTLRSKTQYQKSAGQLHANHALYDLRF